MRISEVMRILKAMREERGDLQLWVRGEKGEPVKATQVRYDIIVVYPPSEKHVGTVATIQ